MKPDDPEAIADNSGDVLSIGEAATAIRKATPSGVPVTLNVLPYGIEVIAAYDDALAVFRASGLADRGFYVEDIDPMASNLPIGAELERLNL